VKRARVRAQRAVAEITSVRRASDALLGAAANRA
jgi:hypothetical protein